MPPSREASDREPLLPQSDRGRNRDQARPSTRSAFAVTIAISVLLMLADICNDITLAPRMVIFEDIICRDYYTDIAGVTDCKIEPVQSELARINGWKRTFTMIPGLVLSIPYGALADRIGRSKVLSLALCGVLLNECWTAVVSAVPQVFPLRAVWLSGVFTLFGGGPSTVVSMCYAIIADACLPHQRTTAFSLIYAGFLISEIVSIPLGAALIPLNPWIPVLGAIGLRLLFTLSTIAVTVKYHKHGRHKDALTDDQSLQSTSSSSPQTNLPASYLIALRAVANMLVLFVIIPSISRTLRRNGIPSPRIDQWITITSGAVLVLGSLLIFLSPSPSYLVLGQIVTALGFAFTVTARSFLTTLAPTRYMGLLSTSISVASHGAIVVGGPFLAWVFQAGLDMGDVWIGLPFLVNAVLFTLGTIAVFCARVSDEHE
ncbi:MFS transporter [Aspergillus lucknowensis]|uniref:Uncharacterized protein n=1 Tax=Aspergillus lucknowensis TaxID=176173 RepID=A0ABR4LSR0_9EURO